MNQPAVTVNGERRPLVGLAPQTTALDWLRDQGLTGCKEGCAEGECGACVVLFARPGIGTPTEWTALDACLVPALGLSGQEIVTVEGLGSPERLHPVQHEVAVRGGTQCGYCTPGFVCSMAAEYYRPSRPADRADGGFDLDALGGNLCRCTGYRPLRDAARALRRPAVDDPLVARTLRPPPALPPVRTDAFVRPGDLAEALRAVAAGALVVAGSTDIGVDMNLEAVRPRLRVAVGHLPELRAFDVTADHVTLGAALTFSELERRLHGRIPMLDDLFPLFASRPVRNAATLGGNLATASPIGDAAPALLALEATAVLVSEAGNREVPLPEFFTGYRTTALRPGELIREVRIPLPLARLGVFRKISKRRLDDISSCAVAVALDLVDGIVARVRIGLGGVAATPIRAVAAEAALTGRPWDSATVDRAAQVLGGEGTPIDDLRASAAYRSAMLEQTLRKVYAESAAGVERGPR